MPASGTEFAVWTLVVLPATLIPGLGIIIAAAAMAVLGCHCASAIVAVARSTRGQLSTVNVG